MPTFTGAAARMIGEGCLVKPVLGEFLSSNEPFKLTLRTGKPLDREPDGWFHASTHPGMSEGELVAYLRGTGPGDHDDFGYVGRMSVMFGTIMHEVVRQALVQMKIAVPVPAGTCQACLLEQPRQCREHGVSQPDLRSRGHLDGILWLGLRSARVRPLTSEFIWGFDFKSIKPQLLIKAPDMDLGFFRERWPKYWWQAQEYMRMTGLVRFIVLFMAMGNPWDMREYHIEADPGAHMEIEARYRSALATAGLPG